MAGKGLSDDEKIELKEQFLQIDKDESGQVEIQGKPENNGFLIFFFFFKLFNF